MGAMRPPALFRTGGRTTAGRIAARFGEVAILAPGMPWVREQTRWPVVETPPRGRLRLVNGRWPGAEAVDEVAALRPGEALRDKRGDLLAAVGEGEAVAAWLAGGAGGGRGAGEASRVLAAEMLEVPWALVRRLPALLAADLAETGGWSAGSGWGRHPVLAQEEVSIAPGAVLDTRGGPIALAAGAAVEPQAVVSGPAWIGRGARVVPGAWLRGPVVLGEGVVAGGEVNHAVLDDFARKGHAGYLGHALIGRWCNFGAGTVASNHKNTHGTVRVSLAPGERQETGMEKLGPLFGDYVRTGIGTRLTTGAVAGTGAMIAESGITPRHVPAFAFWTDRGRVQAEPARLLEALARWRDAAGRPLGAAERTWLEQACRAARGLE